MIFNVQYDYQRKKKLGSHKIKLNFILHNDNSLKKKKKITWIFSDEIIFFVRLKTKLFIKNYTNLTLLNFTKLYYIKNKKVRIFIDWIYIRIALAIVVCMSQLSQNIKKRIFGCLVKRMYSEMKR